MSLLENLNEAQKTEPTQNVCIVARLLTTFEATTEEREKIDALLWPTTGDARVPTTHLARALRKSGIAVSDKSLERHRTRDCVCYR